MPLKGGQTIANTRLENAFQEGTPALLCAMATSCKRIDRGIWLDN